MDRLAEARKPALKAFDLKRNTMLIALVGLMLVFQFLIVSGGKGNFFSPPNITNLIAQNSYVVILAVGMLICILTGGNIDLSVGSGVCMISAIGGMLMVENHVNIYVSMVICILIGIGIGAFQGYFIAYVRIPAFIVTLAGMLIFRGVGYVLLGGFTIAPFPDEYSRIFNGFIPAGAEEGTRVTVTMAVAAAVCVVLVVAQATTRIRKQRKLYAVESFVAMIVKLVVICAVIIAVFWLLSQNKGIPIVLITLGVIIFVYQWYTSKSVPGRHLYAMGGNEKAAIFSGVNTNKVMFFAYTNMGFLVAVASLVCLARFNSAAPSAGTGYELDAIGACFIGGASAYGGVGTVGGSVIGAVFMGVLNNGMSILGIDANWQRAVKGIVLLVAVLIDVQSRKKRGKSTKGIFGLGRPKDAAQTEE
ncbi:MAG: sugar ABC transporter permease [Clostridiales bacterium]|nr:sugar ABC transporter permease [Clostridiales bacterium]